ncbi:protein DpdF [Paraburkholderia unamae]|uniref:Helicase-like protein n=1 Tax=Paraburkholderia unamae TaxID=219649 RepID=A0ABX5KY24_9BURK|nr:protein DpdF [Paraburkholderia unamae]PVX97691.1 helicase-like protein [Paraburkholderia unamae]
MSRSSFGDAELRECLADWPNACASLAASGATGLLERLRQVLALYADGPPPPSHVDLAALLRQWLLFQVKNAGAPWLRVPTTSKWPERRFWEGAGFNVLSYSGKLEIQAMRPRLAWLGNQSDLFDDAHDRLKALTPDWMPAEPVVAGALPNVDSFTGPGQREAARALLQMPADITLIAALPTGNGKSLLAQLPPLLNGDGELTLAIMPTVALAIDQGRRMAKWLRQKHPDWDEHPLAFHGGLTADERSAVFRSVANGSQRILFTSPEAATGSLRSLLESCAEAGGLSHVVVDEAHLVATWGSGFRPSFQLIPALIARLRALTPRPIRVVLASATLTTHTVQMLQRQFGPVEKTRLICGLYLRPEPRYAAALCSSLADKRARVIEALRAAPRPFILYVTRPSEAVEWLQLLRADGFQRIANFTGETRADARKTLLGQWERDELDGMIATSAFGLGVDKGDVRTIVHATFPESLDRFYQEVGRSGRDGIASASLLLYTNDDAKQALQLANTRHIGNELGFQRWTAMIDHAIPSRADDGEIWVDLNRLRPSLNTRGRSNLAWNLRTLNLMASAGLVEICALSASLPAPSQQTKRDLDESDTAIAYAAVRLPDGDHRTRSVFEVRMQRARAESRRAARVGFELMLSIARSERPVEDALRELYRLTMPIAWGPVKAYCGGCRHHWQDRVKDPVTPRPFVARLDQFASRPGFEEAMPAFPRELPNLAFVVVDDIERVLHESAPGLIDALISRLCPHTIAMMRGTPAGLLTMMRARLKRLHSDAFIDMFDASASDLPPGGVNEVRLLIWPSEVMPTALNLLLAGSAAAMTVVIMSSTIRDPDRPDRAWPSVLSHIDEESAIQALTS